MGKGKAVDNKLTLTIWHFKHVSCVWSAGNSFVLTLAKPSYIQLFLFRTDMLQ